LSFHQGEFYYVIADVSQERFNPWARDLQNGPGFVGKYRPQLMLRFGHNIAM
jgi:hypothetical protein